MNRPSTDSGTKVMTPEEFWSRVDIDLEDPSACWLYRPDAPGYRTPTGHIRISVGGGKHQYAHRYAYAASIGPVGSWQVLHACDRPNCMAPRCLSLGDAARNVAERERRNRRTPYLKKAPQHHSSRLSQAEAEEIRQAHREGVPVATLIEEYGIGQTTIRAILRGERYINVVPEIAATSLSKFSRESGQSL